MSECPVEGNVVYVEARSDNHAAQEIIAKSATLGDPCSVCGVCVNNISGFRVKPISYASYNIARHRGAKTL